MRGGAGAQRRRQRGADDDQTAPVAGAADAGGPPPEAAEARARARRSAGRPARRGPLEWPDLVWVAANRRPPARLGREDLHDRRGPEAARPEPGATDHRAWLRRARARRRVAREPLSAWRR